MNVVGFSGLSSSVAFKKRALPGLAREAYQIAQGFDSAAALVTGGQVRAAAAEERFTGEKKTGAFPARAIRYCLASAGSDARHLDVVAHGFDYEPYRSLFEQDQYSKAQFNEVYAKAVQVRFLEEHFPAQGLGDKLVQVPHHLAHAASAFYLSGFEDALILVSDGMGEVDSATVAVGRGSQIEIVERIPALHSLGMLYALVTVHLGFEAGFDEFKVMGLAPYGDPGRYYARFMELVELRDDGTYRIPLFLADKSLLERETHEGVMRELARLFGPRREPESDFTRVHTDLAAALQAALQAVLLHVLRHFRAATGQRNLCMAGGVALNCTANGVIGRSRLFRSFFVQPAAGDDGTALGAALYVERTGRSGPRRTASSGDSRDSGEHADSNLISNRRMGLPLWGPEYSPDEIEIVLAGYPECESTRYERFDDLVAETAGRLAVGEIVGWFQGRMEFGPRALGNRSILADPRDCEMRERINRLVKKREAFRPFAPAVTAEAADRFFAVGTTDKALYAHMLVTSQVLPQCRAVLPAVTHVDGSARLQVVSKDQSPRFWALLDAFGARTGLPVLLNTSLNVRGQPIVCTPDDAVGTFLAARFDILVLGDYLVRRSPDASGEPSAGRAEPPVTVR